MSEHKRRDAGTPSQCNQPRKSSPHTVTLYIYGANRLSMNRGAGTINQLMDPLTI